MTMISSYINKEQEYIKKYGSKTMFLIQCGSFYEVYSCKKHNEFQNDRINDFSRICDMRIANKKSKHNGLSVFMSGFPELHIEKYVKKLNDAGWTVAVHSQDPTCPQIRTESGIYSPGTNFDIISSENNYISAIWIVKYNKNKLNKSERISCGASTIDIGSGEVITFEYVEEYFNNPITFDELERFNCSYPARETIIIHNLERFELEQVMEYSEIKSNLIHDIDLNHLGEWETLIVNCQKQTYQESDLTRYYNINDYDFFYETHKLREREYSTQSLIFLLNFLEQHNHNLVRQLKEPVYTNLKHRVKLANHSLRQLNIIDNDKSGKYSSLNSLINKCKTAMGKRGLKNQLLNPSCDAGYLNNEYAITRHVIDNFEWEKSYNDLSKFTDFERMYRKIILNKISPSELIMLLGNLKSLMSITTINNNNKILKGYLFIENLSSSVNKLKDAFGNFLDTEKSNECSSTDIDKNIFKKGVYPEIDEMEFNYLNEVTKLGIIRKWLSDLITDKKGGDNVRIHRTEKSGSFLIMTKSRYNKLKIRLNDIKNKLIPFNYIINGIKMEFTFDVSDTIRENSSNGNNVRLDNYTITSIYNKIEQLESNFKKILKIYYKKYVASMLGYKDCFDVVIKYITKMDILFTRVYVATCNNYCTPVIDDSQEYSFLDAKDIRHPLIEKIQDGEIYVPNDISLGLEDGHTGILLFGTNAVGKSSLIRSIGMNIVMAQAGFFVPCSSFRYKPYTSIFTRILGNDDIFKGLSTFAVEMSELGNILKNVDKNSLVLGDELCSGTEVTSALCIFSAGTVMLHEKNSSFIFATHYHQLIEYQEIKGLDRLSLQHMSVHYDERIKGLVYNRKLQMGSGNKLYGLEVCKSLNMPSDFLNLANKIRCKNIKGNKLTLNSKQSKYNAKKIIKMCEMCEIEPATETHHMAPQQDADEDGFIGNFHKNHKANLCSICTKCHKTITLNNKKHVRRKTENGMRIMEN